MEWYVACVPGGPLAAETAISKPTTRRELVALSPGGCCGDDLPGLSVPRSLLAVPPVAVYYVLTTPQCGALPASYKQKSEAFESASRDAEPVLEPRSC